jgi:hypothetical protein
MNTVRSCGLLAMLVLAAGLGCSSPEDGQESANGTERGADAAEAADAEAGVEADADGGVSTAKSTQDGATAALPEGFPADVPVYPGLVLHTAAAMPGGHSVQGTTDDDADAVAAFYTRQMASQGWTQDADAEQSPVTQTLSFEKDGRTTSIDLLPTGDRTAVLITSLGGG